MVQTGRKNREITDSYLVDTHCHLDMDAYAGDLDGVVAEASSHGVRRIITVGIDEKSSSRAVSLARRFREVWATVGIHPHNSGELDETSLAVLKELALDPTGKVVGYGEIGLDYAKKYAPPDLQRDCFSRQLSLAGELGLPVIIHDRDAHADTLAILREHAPFTTGGVMHCFSGDPGLAWQVIELGLHISIPGIVTFRNSATLQEVAREIPLDRMLLETDGPFLSPEPKRGRVNRPAYLVYTAKKIAELRGIELGELARRTSANAAGLFRLPALENPA
ncbi:MAG: hypothetical protein Kow0089_01020 [Desulfobulbaceae bacterium]